MKSIFFLLERIRALAMIFLPEIERLSVLEDLGLAISLSMR
jgi:hypothetical protein